VGRICPTASFTQQQHNELQHRKRKVQTCILTYAAMRHSPASPQFVMLGRTALLESGDFAKPIVSEAVIFASRVMKHAAEFQMLMPMKSPTA
jgi:hypothetical protein